VGGGAHGTKVRFRCAPGRIKLAWLPPHDQLSAMFSSLLDRALSRFPRALAWLGWMRRHRKLSWTLFFVFWHLLGALTSVRAILDVRTSQGAIAWVVSLNTFPYVAVPAYWVFGRSDFEGYVVLRRKAEAEWSDAERQLARDLLAMRPAPDAEPPSANLLEKLAKLPATRGNHTELLIDGEATFRAIFESIEQARDYVLVQFYIVHDDGLGRRLKDALIARARTGVRCFMLYDEVGSHDLPASYLKELRAAGVDIRPFNTRQGDANRFQLNFRNHRKIVIVDGHTAFVGGHNVGDEYLGKNPTFGPWRDTHVKVQGPVVQCIQVSWFEDWIWAAGNRPVLNWKPQAAPGDEDALAFCLPSGPADEFETCTLFFLHAINAAKKRVWIAPRISCRTSSSSLRSSSPPCAESTCASSCRPTPTISSFTFPASPFCPSWKKRGCRRGATSGAFCMRKRSSWMTTVGWAPRTSIIAVSG
jgi:cardiolipin synthase